jgi:hypothetical protein
VADAELNPNPLHNAPWLLFFLHPLVSFITAHSAGPLAGIAAVAALNAQRAMAAYRSAPTQDCQLVIAEKGSLFSAFPAISRAGLFFQAQTGDRYILRWQHDGEVEDLSFDGEAFHPIAPDPAGPIYFELAARGTSRMMQFDPFTRKTVASPMPMNFHASDAAAGLRFGSR